MCLAYLLTCYLRVFYNQALADVRLTGVEIKCLNCSDFKQSFYPQLRLTDHQIVEVSIDGLQFLSL